MYLSHDLHRLDDETGEPLYQRADDTREALPKRLEGYHSETVPILDHYGRHGIVVSINANAPMEEICSNVGNVVGVLNLTS